MKSLDRTINKVRIHKYNLLKNLELILDNDSETKEYNDAINNINNDTDHSTDNSTNNTTNNTTASTTTSTTTNW